eukprot:SAG11_NODE_264_length_11522_cov_14.739210_4_plen_72_part_00
MKNRGLTDPGFPRRKRLKLTDGSWVTVDSAQEGQGWGDSTTAVEGDGRGETIAEAVEQPDNGAYPYYPSAT